MNTVREIKRLNEKELEYGASGTKNSWHETYRPSAYIYIGNLDYRLTEGDIIAIFSQFGEPVHVSLARDGETGKSIGFAFLKYLDQRSTDLAVDNLNGITLLGRTLRVDHKLDYKPKKKDDDEEEEEEDWVGKKIGGPHGPPILFDQIGVGEESKTMTGFVDESKSERKRKKKEKKKEKKRRKRDAEVTTERDAEEAVAETAEVSSALMSDYEKAKARVQQIEAEKRKEEERKARREREQAERIEKDDRRDRDDERRERDRRDYERRRRLDRSRSRSRSRERSSHRDRRYR